MLIKKYIDGLAMNKRSFMVFICWMLFIFCSIIPRIGNAAAPVILSIEPNFGVNSAPTTITIKGSGFSASPTVSFYGGGPYITGAAIRRMMLLMSM